MGRLLEELRAARIAPADLRAIAATLGRALTTADLPVILDLEPREDPRERFGEPHECPKRAGCLCGGAARRP